TLNKCQQQGCAVVINGQILYVPPTPTVAPCYYCPRGTTNSGGWDALKIIPAGVILDPSQAPKDFLSGAFDGISNHLSGNATSGVLGIGRITLRNGEKIFTDVYRTGEMDEDDIQTIINNARQSGVSGTSLQDL